MHSLEHAAPLRKASSSHVTVTTRDSLNVSRRFGFNLKEVLVSTFDRLSLEFFGSDDEEMVLKHPRDVFQP
jgi:hypothetical protein